METPNPIANPVGRPTGYKPAILEQAQEYLKNCVDEEEDWIKSKGDKSTTYEHRVKVDLPSIEGLARYLGVARSSVYKWSEENPEFSDILEDILAEQANRLMNMGLSGDYNSTIAKLILTKHGYTDKTDLTSGGQPIVEDEETRLLAKQAIHEYISRKNVGNGGQKEAKTAI